MPQSHVSNASKAPSKVSNQSRKTVSKNSYVDEALFGNAGDRAKASAPRSTTGGAVVIGKDQLRTIREAAQVGKQKDALMITQNELDRMKNTTVIKSNDEKLQEKKLLDEQKDQQMAAAKARKKKMMEMDRERQKKLQPTDFQKDQTTKNETLLTKAKDQLDEEHDDVKEMNNMCLYSKVVTIRDRQLLESKRLEHEYLEEQKRIDLMMEIERLKTLKMQEEREAARKQAQKEGCLVIIDQIKERELERIKEQELREKEAQMMLQHIENLKQEEVKMA